MSAANVSLIDPKQFLGKEPFFSEAKTGESWFLLNSKRVGYLFCDAGAGDSEEWVWLLTAPYCAGTGVKSGGVTHSREHAQAEIYRAFKEWLIWAVQQGRPVPWYFDVW
jgi:hypothetical protein